MRRDRDIGALHLLTIGLGAGLSSQEISRLAGTDVRKREGLVLVDVIGRRSRTVPVLRIWAPRVLELAEESGSHAFLLPDRSRITRGDVTAFIGRCSDREEAAFNVQRLRITWMVSQLAAGTHLGSLVRASGVTPAQLTKYLSFVPPLDDDVAYRALSQVGGP